jgi:hypothetical protein
MVIDSSFSHIVVLKWDDEGTKMVHCEVLEWNKTLKKHLQHLLALLGTCYTVVDNEHSLKFNILLGAKIVGKQDKWTILRYS